ncbi:MAG: potassium channel family protein [Gammaproteobacteria bacterium]
MDAQSIYAALLTLLLIMVTTVFHFEALRFLAGFVGKRRRTHYGTLISLLVGVIAVHVIEIGLYAGAYVLGTGPLNLGSFKGAGTVTGLDFFYFAAETYSTLGYGDVIPTGQLRLIASIEPLNGLMLLAWSGSFLFILIQDVTSKVNERRDHGHS